METQKLDFEQGPIRPPSESGSLLLRVTRNCPWNRCAFCSTYKGKKFSRRPIIDVLTDIDNVARIYNEIKEMSWTIGEGGEFTNKVISSIFKNGSLPDYFRSVAYWIASGADTVFLQDANSLMLSTEALLEILNHIRKNFPQVSRVTSYARASTLKTKTVDEYIRLKECGLTRLHVGMESGSDEVLKLIDKGCKSEQLLEGGKRVVEAGISLSLYVIPGIGGVELSDTHVRGTVRVINGVNPTFVRFRSLYVRHNTPLAELVNQGRFTPPDEDHIVMEIRAIIQGMENVTTTVVSDHILNLLEEVQGKFPGDKNKMLSIIDRYLNLPNEDRLMYQLGRRGGAFRSVDDLFQPGVRERLETAKRQIERDLPGGIPEYIQSIKKRFV
ncbi:MAG: radical SAM protein [Deltaproteobacteria bacterium]|nr:radical SAM protein [Deltaproteobacteria bacterium]